MPSEDIAISVRGLTKAYRIFAHPGERLKQAMTFGLRRYHKEFTALKDVSFDINKGETVGIIGRNGSGKSTLLQLICGILKPTSGSVQVNGRVSALLELGAGFNPEFTGRENVYFQAALMGIPQNEMESRFKEIAAFADIGEFVDQPVRTYSSGMFMRLAFAAAAHITTDILIVDEALSVGDVAFQEKCMVRMRSMIENGVTIVLVSHNMLTIRNFCTRVLALERGRLVYNGESEGAIDLQRGDVHSQPEVDLASFSQGRRGSRNHVELLSLAVSGGDGRPRSVFAMGESLTIRLRIRCRKNLPKARFGVLLTNTSDILIHDFASAFAGIVGLQEGEHGFEIETGPLMVYPGKYFLGAWAQSAIGIPSDDYIRSALAIVVEDRKLVGGPEANFEHLHRSNTEVYLPCAWRRLA